MQTEAYARELITYHASITLGVNIDKSVTLRLRRPVGDPAVLVSQLDYLLEMTGNPNVTFQVIPRDVGVHPALKGAFCLFRFEDDWRVGYKETRRFAYYYDSPDAVEDHEKVMSHLRHLDAGPEAVAGTARRGEKGSPVIDNWRTSTYSADNSMCVETGWADGMVGYRDTKQATLPKYQRPTLMVGKDAADAFLTMIRSMTS